MKEINLENREAVVMAIQEIIDTSGQLWITLCGKDYYIPELLQELKEDEDNVI